MDIAYRASSFQYVRYLDLDTAKLLLHAGFAILLHTGYAVANLKSAKTHAVESIPIYIIVEIFIGACAFLFGSNEKFRVLKRTPIL